MVDFQILILRNQVKTLINELTHIERLENSEGLYQQSVKLLDHSKKLFPENEIAIFIPKFDDNTSKKHRSVYESVKIEQILFVMDHLLSYIDIKIGNPVAIELLDGTLDEASEMLREGHCLCAAALIRLALEQGLRTLCEMNGVEFDQKDMVGTLNDRLKKANVLEQPVWREIQAKLDVLNDVIHNNKDNCESDLIRTCSWVETFLAKKLGGA